MEHVSRLGVGVFQLDLLELDTSGPPRAGKWRVPITLSFALFLIAEIVGLPEARVRGTLLGPAFPLATLLPPPPSLGDAPGRVLPISPL